MISPKKVLGILMAVSVALVSGCTASTVPDSMSATEEKYEVYNREEFNTLALVPENVVIEGDRMGIVFFNTKTSLRKIMFYDVSDLEGPQLYAETAWASQAQGPFFNSSGSSTYALLADEGKWTVFRNADPLFEIDGLFGLAMTNDDKIFVIGQELGVTGLFTEEGLQGTPFLIAIGLSVVGSEGDDVAFYGLRGNTDWILANGKGETTDGPYSFISRLAVAPNGKLGFIARSIDAKKWYAVFDGRKRRLEKDNYNEIAVVSAGNRGVAASAQVKGVVAEWDVLSNNDLFKTIVGPTEVPMVYAKNNGDVVYSDVFENKVRMIDGGFISMKVSQLEQFVEDKNGITWGMVKRTNGAWSVLSAVDDIGHYFWTSRMSLDEDGNVVFLSISGGDELNLIRIKTSQTPAVDQKD
ncbi:MAG: hypothetical protein AAB592_02280 [Patescibacteria group bacterium]